MIELTDEMRALFAGAAEAGWDVDSGLTAVLAIVERDYRLTRRPPKPQSKQRTHLFEVDPDTPGCCGSCHLPGQPGDARHTLPDVPEQAEVAARYEPDGGDV